MEHNIRHQELDNLLKSEQRSLPEMLKFASQLNRFLQTHNADLNDVNNIAVEMIIEKFRGQLASDTISSSDLVSLQSQTVSDLEEIKHSIEMSPKTLFNYINNMKLAVNMRVSKDLVDKIIPMFKGDYIHSGDMEQKDILHFILSSYSISNISLENTIDMLVESGFNLDVFSEVNDTYSQDYYQKASRQPYLYSVLAEKGVPLMNSDIQYNGLSHLIASIPVLNGEQLNAIDSLVRKMPEASAQFDSFKNFPIFNLFFRMNIKNSDDVETTKILLENHNWHFSEEGLEKLLKKVIKSDDFTERFMNNISCVNIFYDDDSEEKLNNVVERLFDIVHNEDERSNLSKIVEKAF